MVGAVLALAVAIISLESLDAQGNQLFGLFLIGLSIIGLLAVLLLIIWIYYLTRDKGRTPLCAHGIMWGPVVLAACIVPVSESMDDARKSRFEDAHPVMQEIHINLTGRDLWFDPRNTGGTHYTEMPMRGDKPEKFLEWSLYPSPELIGSGAFLYEGSRLKQNVRSMRLYTGELLEEKTKSIEVLIANKPSYPDTDRLASVMGFRQGHDATILVHQYYHYPDHIEVAPALTRFAGSQRDRLWGKIQPVVEFRGVNLGQQPIARLEINGQAMSLGEEAFSVADTCFWANTPVGEAILTLDQPLHLRWQTIEPPHRWQEATVPVPKFLTENSKGERTRVPSVVLYFTGEGSVFAERFEAIDLPAQKLGVRTTGLPEGMASPPPCGMAYAGYNPETVQLLPR
ncbi:hypothetical protein HB779_16410 [Phyllobacterium sp. 628]|uniref:hypothetical protein n=1 Tax=Phyllobacterium sp. 628 TaxID=2718938 RepID=UPI0016623440|nr:hypothetical protein [Phyllobacterium sp. 628]QND53296.1 hypothetical protein HB779_16410 [Phyllobacterium sp. 628]